MVGAVCLAIWRGFFFVGFWAYVTMYGIEIIQWMSKFKSTIESINQKEKSDEGIKSEIVGVFVLAWLVFGSMACK